MLETYLAAIDDRSDLALSLRRRAFQNRERAIGSYRALSLMAALPNRGLKRRVAQGRVALVVVGISSAVLLE